MVETKTILCPFCEDKTQEVTEHTLDHRCTACGKRISLRKYWYKDEEGKWINEFFFKKPVLPPKKVTTK